MSRFVGSVDRAVSAVDLSEPAGHARDLACATPDNSGAVV